MNPLSLLPISLLIPIAINIGFGIYVLRNTVKSAANRQFSVFIFSVATWVFFNFMFYAIGQNYFFGKLMYAAGTLPIATGIVWLRLVQQGNTSMIKQLLLYLPYALIGVVVMIDGLLIVSFHDIDTLPWPIEFELGPLFPWFSMLLSLSIIYIVSKSWLIMYHSSGIKRMQWRYIFIGLLLMGLIPISTSLLPPLFGIHSIGFLDAYSSFLWVALLVYAITRHRFLDIRVVFRKSLVVGSLLVVSLAIVITFLLFTKKIVSTYFNVSDDILVLASMTILLLIFPKLKHSCQKLIDRYIFTDYIDLSAKIQEFEESAPKSKMMQELAQRTGKFIHDNMKVENVRFLVYDHISKDRLVSYWPSGDNLILQTNDPLLQLWQSEMNVIIKEELQLKAKTSDLEKRAIRRLEMLHAEVAVPYGEHGQCYGMLLLGQKVDQQAFSTNELDLLTKVARSLTHLVPQIATVEMTR